MAQKYSQKFRLQMVRRLVGPGAITASALSAETGVAQSTLSRWLRQAGTMSNMTNDEGRGQGAERPAREWTAEERLRVLLEAAEQPPDRLGAFLRAQGVHEVELNAWRDAALNALDPRRRRRRSPLEKEVRTMRAELARKDKALAETAALLVLRGKARALWGEEGESTPRTSGRKRSR